MEVEGIEVKIRNYLKTLKGNFNVETKIAGSIARQVANNS
jgi:hypothetical protein